MRQGSPLAVDMTNRTFSLPPMLKFAPQRQGSIQRIVTLRPPHGRHLDRGGCRKRGRRHEHTTMKTTIVGGGRGGRRRLSELQRQKSEISEQDKEIGRKRKTWNQSQEASSKPSWRMTSQIQKKTAIIIKAGGIPCPREEVGMKEEGRGVETSGREVGMSEEKTEMNHEGASVRRRSCMMNSSTKLLVLRTTSAEHAMQLSHYLVALKDAAEQLLLLMPENLHLHLQPKNAHQRVEVRVGLLVPLENREKTDDRLTPWRHNDRVCPATRQNQSRTRASLGVRPLQGEKHNAQRPISLHLKPNPRQCADQKRCR